MNVFLMDVNIIIAIVGCAIIVCSLLSEAFGFVLSALTAYVGLLLLYFSECINLTDNSLLFWGIASLLASGIAILSPRKEPNGGRHGNRYLLLGATAGLLVGMSIDASVMTLSAIIGTILGQLFYCRTPSGKWIKFSFHIFIRYLCSVGLKIIVSIAIAGVAVMGFLKNQPAYMC